MKICLYCIISALLIIVFGCAGSGKNTSDSKPDAVLPDIPDELKPAYQKLSEEGESNKVLNLMRLGIKAFQIGQLKESEKAFDQALLEIERVYADSEQAAGARSMWAEEGRKIFKGEPYERAMTYYYRGLLYILEKDYENARASFRGGILQDAFAEEEQNRCDFALMLYLSGWCSQRIDDEILTKAAFEELKSLRADVAVPESSDNFLLIVETGTSPRKVGDGIGNYQLKFRHGKKFTEKKVKHSIGTVQNKPMYLMEDIFFQASSRGGRQFDYILNGKASFQQKTSETGAVLSDIGTGTMVVSSLASGSSKLQGGLQGAAAGLGLIGVVSQIAASKVETAADIRYWDNLPDGVHIASCHLDPGEYELTLDFSDEKDNALPALKKNVKVVIPENEPKLLWLRSAEER